MITFKQQITVPEELVEGLAVFLGYKPTLTRINEIVDDDTTDPVTVHHEEEEYPNPETAIEYIDKLAKENTAKFFKPFGEKLVQDELTKLGIDEQKKQAEAQLEQAIVMPVMDALITEIVKD